MQNWFIKNLPNARKVLKSFKSLDFLLDNFRDYETKRYREVRNLVMFLSLPRITGGVKSNAIRRLARLEKTIEMFGIMDWPPSKLNSLQARLASEVYVQSLSAATELEVAYYLAQKLGRTNVELYPRLVGGGLSDVSVRLNNKNIFLEVGNLGESLPEKKIQEILKKSARYLGKNINAQCYLCLHVDTAKLSFDKEGRIRVRSSINKLNSEIDMLAIHKLAGFKGYFNIREIASAIENQLLYKRIGWKMLNKQLQNLLVQIRSRKMKSWLNSFDPALLKKAELIKSIIAGPGTSTLLVEIHPLGFFPSEASIAERRSFLNHLVRNIETQIEEKQIQPNAPNIILIQGYNWTVFALDPAVLHDRLRQFFDQRRNEHLSGIAMFGAEIERTAFISNKYAKGASQLAEASVKALGFVDIDQLRI